MLLKLWDVWLSVEGKKTKAGMILYLISLFVHDPDIRQALAVSGQALGGVGIGDWLGRSIGSGSGR